jgi:hypothetical protein
MASIIRARFAPRCRGRQLLKIALLCLCLIFAATTPARPQGSVGNFTTIDVHGAGTGVLQGTVPVSINAAGGIAGFYTDTSGAWHGFLLPAGGTMIYPIDGPGAGTGTNQGTFPFSINTKGDIAGYYSDGSTRTGLYHGFMRAADGMITPINVPGAYAGFDLGTGVASINTGGKVTGFYRDARAVYHGFVRDANGRITLFEAPDAGTGTYAGTEPISINTAGDITGMYTVSFVLHAHVYHGFVRAAANGAITEFDAPGAGGGKGDNQGTFPISINTAVKIAGMYSDASDVFHGFVRAANGMITTFVAPGAGPAGSSMLSGTGAASINDWGDIAGFYVDASGVLHGFVRTSNGTITPFDAPGAGPAGTSLFPGTIAASINDSGDITGTYADPSGVFHGYVAKFTATPQAQISDLHNLVEDLVSARTLGPGQGQFLLAPLNEALAALGPATATAAQPASNPGGGEVAPANRGHAAAAIRDLEEFIGRVRLLVLFRQLSPTEGRTLIDAAESIISTLRSKP